MDRRGAWKNCQIMSGGAGACEPWTWYLRRKAKPVEAPIARMAKVARRQYVRARRGVKTVVLWIWPSCPRLQNRRSVGSAPTAAPKVQGAVDYTCDDLTAGDWVRVRNIEQIRATLDERSCCRGCYFMKSMARHCGQCFRVLKVVERFYDEVQGRMLRCKNVVFLDGVYCDGSGHPDTHGCDRTCFSFWRTEWLEKTVPSAT